MRVDHYCLRVTREQTMSNEERRLESNEIIPKTLRELGT
jgi:hypothetical protein